MIESPMKAWETFYVIVGSSAGALTGLQFVVLTLVADLEIEESSQDTVSAFGTPTVVHFCSALLLSAILSAPWPSPTGAGYTVALLGLAGVIYTFMTLMRARRQLRYQPVLEDWIWHTILPGISYATLLPASDWLRSNPETALFPIGGAALLLVLIGIHNAYDSVIYITLVLRRSQRQATNSAPPPQDAAPPPGAAPPAAPEPTSTAPPRT